jgi:L-iditol 2-dehydrogenase
MKALVLEQYMKLVYQDVPMPGLADDEVLVRVKAVGICGSDVHGMDGSTGRRIPPIIMGHEASGVIEAMGPKVSGWQKGDRVTFDSTIYRKDDWYTQRGMYNLSDGRMVLGVSTPEFRKHGAFAEYVTVPQHILYRIPDGVSFLQAALVEPAAVSLHAINLTPIHPDDTVLVVGAGMVGMFVIQLLRIRGCKHIVAVDLETSRLELAKKLGAEFAFVPNDPQLQETIHDLTNNRGADCALEVVGVAASVQLGISLLRKGGTMTLLGNLSPEVPIPLQAVVTKQLRLQGSCAINGEYPEILDLISQGKLDMEAILSAEAPLSEGAQWFDRLYKKEKGLMKVILKP